MSEKATKSTIHLVLLTLLSKSITQTWNIDSAWSIIVSSATIACSFSIWQGCFCELKGHRIVGAKMVARLLAFILFPTIWKGLFVDWSFIRREMVDIFEAVRVSSFLCTLFQQTDHNLVGRCQKPSYKLDDKIELPISRLICKSYFSGGIIYFGCITSN